MRFFRWLGSLLLSLLVDMLFHPVGLIAVVLLLVLHFWRDWPIWWFVGALALWAAVLLLRSRFIDSASRAAARRDVPRKKY